MSRPEHEPLDARPNAGQVKPVQPLDMQVIGHELAIKWEDGTESFIGLETLRRHCPCAGCQGERDMLGQLHKLPARPLTPTSFQMVRLARVGGYAVQPVWADGHNTGLYSFDYLRRLAAAPPLAEGEPGGTQAP